MITGGCLCGKVRYESQGDALFGVLCHCRDCQRVSGTGRVPVMGVLKSTFRVTGETKSYSVWGWPPEASYSPLSTLSSRATARSGTRPPRIFRSMTRFQRSEEHTSELQSLR